MPFTASHPAIILPLLKLRSKWFSTTGLVVGSLSPDFEYFFRLEAYSEISHTLRGIFLFNLPLSFVLATIFHLYVRDEVVHHLPAFLQRRAYAVKPVRWMSYLKRNWLVFSVSAIIGATSHVFWDDFTNVNGYVQRVLPIIQDGVNVFGKEFIIARLIQHVSTIVGGLIVAAYILSSASKPVRYSVSRLQKVKFWTAVSVLSFSFLVFSALTDLTTDYIKSLAVTLLSGLLLGTLFVSLVARSRRLYPNT
ncbi:DUF4184 family protein [Pontibacter sp. SGAir0037]|uniref:DUF4184 family protein n=1 Tax=Pontibacter sp. SGAir0037 TaxID=2571030 RepID=UPI00143DA639|nr:DUF4184 family protein [Pontibacter sp. SGAir0037]